MKTPQAPDPEEIRRLYETRQMEAIAKRWDARAGAWDADLNDPECHLNHDASYGWFLETAAELIDKRGGFCSANGVIDCGCGTGLVLAAVAPTFAWGVGIDISTQMIRMAAQKNIGRCRFIAGDCFRLSELCPKAGAVLSRGVLLSHYGIEQGLALLRAMRESLVEEGFVVCDFLNDSARSIQIHAPENKTYYSRQTIAGLALEAGFKTAAIIGADNRRTLILSAQR